MTDLIETVGSGKDYANISAWIQAHNGDNPLADATRYIAHVFPGTHSDEITHFPQLAATKTNPEFYRWCRVAPGYEGQVNLKTTTTGSLFRLQEENFRLTGLGMENARATGVTFPPLNRCVRIDRACIVESCYMTVTDGWNDLNACIDVTAGLGSGKVAQILSCVCEGNWGRKFTGARIGISSFLASAGAEVRVENCTVWGIQKLSVGAPFPWLGIGIIFGNANNEAVIHNNAVFESRNFDLFQNTAAKSITHNIVGDASVITGGSDNILSAVYADEFVDAPNDFRLLYPTAQSIDSGTTRTWPVDPLDFVRRPHGPDGGWDRGAYSFGRLVGGWRGVAGAPSSSGLGAAPTGRGLAGHPGSGGVTRSTGTRGVSGSTGAR